MCLRQRAAGGCAAEGTHTLVSVEMGNELMQRGKEVDRGPDGCTRLSLRFGSHSSALCFEPTPPPFRFSHPHIPEPPSNVLNVPSQGLN